MAYSHNFTQNLYQSANLAIQHHAQQHMQQHAKEKIRADRKSSGCKKEENSKSANLNNFAREEPHSCGFSNSQALAYSQKVNAQSRTYKVSDQPQHMKSLNLLQNSVAKVYNSTAPALSSTSVPTTLSQQTLCHKSKTEQNLSCTVNPIDENKVKLSHINPSQQGSVPGNQEMATSLVYNTDTSGNNASMHHYECGLNVQLSMDSPASIGSDITQNSTDTMPPTSLQIQQSQQFSDCSMQSQSTNTPMHMTIHTPHVQQQSSVNMSIPSTSSQSINILGNLQHSQQNRKVNQQSDIATSAATSVQRSSTPKLLRTGNASASNHNRQHKSTTSGNSTSSANVSQQQAISNHQNLPQSQQDHIHNMQFSQLGGQHSHHQNMQHVDYISIPQLGQNYSANASNSYDLVPAVIQQRMSIDSTVHPFTGPHRRLDQSTSACAVNNFYLQNNLPLNEVIANPTRISVSVSSAPTNSSGGSTYITAGSGSSSSGTSEQQLTQGQGNVIDSMATPSNTGTTPTSVGNLCSLSKLQQLANGLDIQPCNTSPASQVNLTSPPHHALPHTSMTPPPHLLVTQNRNLTTPPNMLQPQVAPIQYKYYPGNMNVPPISTAQNVNRTTRNTPSAPVQHIAASTVTTSSTSSRTTNVHIPPNLMTPYGAINSYRMSTQQSPATAGYPAGGDFPNSQMQMGVMNMQSQYQDACSTQRAAQPNPMYSTYSPYISLNSSMRR